jgi:hypothetical protein
MAWTYVPIEFTAILGQPHALPDKFQKYIKRFEANGIITIRRYLLKFVTFLENFEVEHDDVRMK